MTDVIEAPPTLRSSNPKAEQLRSVLAQYRGQTHLIVLQDFPDPDALSAAWAYLLICEGFSIKTEIVYAGALSHQENITLVRLTNLPCQRWHSFKPEMLTKFDGVVFIDNQGSTTQLTPHLQAAELPVIAIIDHHSLQNHFQAEFQDIRLNYGATASIVTEYIQAGLLDLDGNSQTHVRCATALMHGLRSETMQLLHANEVDYLAAAYISRYHDEALLAAVLQSTRSRRVMDVIERSIKKRLVRNNFSIAGVGYLRYEDRDAIPQAADFLMTEENVHTAVVYGIVRGEDGSEMVTGSLRTNKLTLDPDEFLKEAFGQDPNGRYFGGGRHRAGGFEIALGFLSGFNDNSEYAEQKWDVFDTQIRQKLARLVNPEDEIVS